MNVDSATLIVLIVFVAVLVGLVFAVDRRWGRGPAALQADTHARTRSPGDVFTIAIWFGLVTAVLHLALAFVNRYVRGQFLMVGPQIVWLAPVSYVLNFVAFGVVLAAVAMVRPRVVPFVLMTGVFAWLGLFAMLLPFRQLHQVAAALLSAGVAVQIARTMARHQDRWLLTMRKTGLLVVVAISVLAMGMAGWRAASERLALASLPAPRPATPNVLLMVLDTVRAASMSLYGYDRDTTPELKRWAADSATFDWAFSTAPWTLTSHATMFTGLYPNQFVGDFKRPVSTPAPMLAEIFRNRGHVTGGFVANLPYTSYESGLTRGFVHYDDYRVTPRQAVLHSWIAQTPLFRGIVGSRSVSDLVTTLRRPSLDFEPDEFNDRTYARRSATAISTAFLDWQAAHGDRPFFAFLNFFDAHIPYRPSPVFWAKFALQKRPNLGLYDGAIASIDYEIGRMLDELRRRGVLDNTIVIVTSDHGEQFGEHGLRLHANSLYLPLLHVPLLMRYPGRLARGSRVDAPVSLRDLAATVIDLAGLSSEVNVPGTSLASLDGDDGGSAVLARAGENIRPSPDWPVFHGPMHAIVDRQFHYIRRGDGQEELFAYRTDPAEAQNLAQTPDGQRALGRLRAQLASQK
jgi:arylsulfatase A-like enzyme